MAAIGMIGNNTGEMARTFLWMCQMMGFRAQQVDMVNLYKINRNDTINITCFNENTPSGRVRVLVVQDASPVLKSCVSTLTEDDYLVLNTDSRDNIKVLSPNAARLVTYGFNPKACVTASSVTDTTLVSCIQHSFPALTGRINEPCEFSAQMFSESDPVTLLGAAAACAVCGLLP